ncbi:MAG: hypothetical protein M3250_08970 [Thermoproteota archaeon]|nr:hypothetical protein [Thermoproteota archaeon]
MIKYKLIVSTLLALVIIFLAHVSSWMTNAQSQDLNTTSSMTIEDRIEMIMGNRITKLMDDTIDMIKNANNTVITDQQSENRNNPVTNIIDVNNTGVNSIDKLEKKLTGNNTALDLDNSSSIDSSNASSISLEEIKKTQTENATINEQGSTAFEEQNISSSSSSAPTVNTTENVSSSYINQKTTNDKTGTHTILGADDNNDNNKSLAATTTNKSTSTNNAENFFTQIGKAVKKFFGGN